MLKLLIVDDEPIVRRGLRQTLPWEQLGITVVGEAKNGIEGLEMAIALKPDIVITDLKMPKLDGIGMIEKIKAAKLNPKFVILSGYGEFSYAKKAIDNEVASYLLKPVSTEEMLKTIEAVVRKIEDKRSLSQGQAILESSREDMKRRLIRKLVRLDYSSKEDLEGEIVFLVGASFHEGRFLVSVLDEKKEEPVELSFFESALEKVLSSAKIPYVDGIYHQRSCFFVAEKRAEEIEKAVRRAFEEYERKTPVTISVGVSRPVTSFEGIPEAYENAKTSAESLLMRFVNSIEFYGRETEKVYSPVLLKALAYIREHYGEELSVSSVSDALNVSSSHLMHLFKKELATTFNTMLVSTRIEEAKKLLKSGEYRVSEVADKVGYNDTRYFTSVFKKVTGRTPVSYIKGADEK